MLKSVFAVVVVCFLSLVTHQCKKDDGDSPQQGNYYFKCEVDGKTINFSFPYPLQTNSAVTAEAGFTIKTNGQNSNCNETGSYCFAYVLNVDAQKEGETDAFSFVLMIPEGGINSNYNTGFGDPKIKVNITKIIHGTYDKPGVLAGTIQGEISKIIDSPFSWIKMPINASFSSPLLN